MKRCFSFLATLLTFTLCVKAQSKEAANNKPLIIVDNHRTDLSLLVLNPDRIESINIVKGEKAATIYGEAGKNGVIIIQSKPSTKLLNFKQLCYKYNILWSDRKLPVSINKTAVADPAMILIDEDELINVDLTDQSINIITKRETETKR